MPKPKTMRFDTFGKFFGLTLLIAGSQLASASNMTDEQVIVSQVLEKYIASQGGRERLESINSLEVKGTMSLDSQGIDITVHQRIVAPDKMVHVHEVPVIGSTENILNGENCFLRA